MNCSEPSQVPNFQQGFTELIGRQPGGSIAEHRFVTVPSNRPPWSDSGLSMQGGTTVTSFVSGNTHLLGTGLHFSGDFQLWFRIGAEGEVFRGTRASHTFTASQPGPLELASYFPGEWSTRRGDMLIPAAAYDQVEGDLTVLLIRWRVEPLEALRGLLSEGDIDGLIAGEIERLTTPVVPPSGWTYLWFLGPAETYRSCSDEANTPAICCHSKRDAALLQKDIALPLTPGTRLRWSWRVDQLPSEVREDELATHDYLSIAVEFDNGQDITYFWSAELPIGTHFRCPIPTWTARETHVVVRTGSAELGRWFDEERDVHADYRAAIGGEPPARIVRVWLIAVSLFQRGEGRCRYRNIAFETEGGLIRVD